MQPFQQRVVEEKADLDEKAQKLFVFMETPTFDRLPKDEQLRLRIQHPLMRLYSEVLRQRIEAFT